TIAAKQLRPVAEPIGTHQLKSAIAQGFGLAFGHSNTTLLREFARSVTRLDAAWIRPCPGRALLVGGIPAAAIADSLVAARAADFIVDCEDLRRHVVACAGAPACSSATLPTRDIAPEVAKATRSLSGSSSIVHLSGCAKGCAHPATAALTIVGPDKWVL